MEMKFHASMADLSKTIPKEKIYLLQISDACKPSFPISNVTDDSGLRPGGRWSHYFRPYPFNGGYLPVVDVAKAVLATGIRCWFSTEVSDRGAGGRGGIKYDFTESTKGVMASHKKLLDACANNSSIR